MIIKFIYFYLFYVFTHRIFVEYGILPNSAKWATDLYSAALIPVIVVIFALRGRFSASVGYLIFYFLIFFIAALGAVINDSDASSLLLGCRHHFKHLPFFLFPLVYDFSEMEIKKMLWLMCGILLLQMPISVLQRFVWFSHLATGDVVSGTFGSSGIMSVVLVSAISILYALYLAKRINPKPMLLLSIILFIPTAINETKATFLMLPIGLTISTLLFGDKNLLPKLKRITVYIVITLVFTSLFVYVYDVMYGSKFETTFLDTITHEKEGRGYLYYGDEKAIERIEGGYDIGRIDSIMLAFKYISKDIGHFAFGVGIGNAATSKVSFLDAKDFDIQKFSPGMTTISNIIWELGVMGLLFQVILYLLIFKNALAMRTHDSFLGALSLGWCSVVTVMGITAFYLNIYYSDVLNTTFWLLSGIVISKCYQFKNNNPRTA